MAESPDVSDCCCSEYASRLMATTDSKLRIWGFFFSAGLLTVLLVAHITFEWDGRHLPTPDIVWAMVLAPWLGASMAKLLRVLKK